MFIFHEKCQTLGHVKMQNLPCNTPLFLVFWPHPERRSFFLSVIQPDLEYAAGACVPSMPESQRQRLLSLWRKAVRCTAGADKHADVYTICGELSITPLLHRWALSFALQVRRCYLNIAPAQLCDKLVRPCHKHSTRGNNSSLYPF